MATAVPLAGGTPPEADAIASEDEGDDEAELDDEADDAGPPLLQDLSPTPLESGVGGNDAAKKKGGKKKEKKAKVAGGKKAAAAKKSKKAQQAPAAAAAAESSQSAAAPEALAAVSHSPVASPKKGSKVSAPPKNSNLHWAFVGTIGGSFGNSALGAFNRPSFVAIEPTSGQVCVSSTFGHQVQILSPRGAAQPLATPAPPASPAPFAPSGPPASAAGDDAAAAASPAPPQPSPSPPPPPQQRAASFFSNPQGIAIPPSGNGIYVADGGNDRVVWLPLRAKAAAAALPPPPGSGGGATGGANAGPGGGGGGGIGRIGMRSASPSPGDPVISAPSPLLVRPLGLAVEEPLVFVASSGNGSIVALAHDTLRLSFSFGREEGPGKLSMPMGVAVYRSGGGGGKSFVYVADRDDSRLAVFTMDGDFVRAIGSRGRAPGQFVEPLGIAIHGDHVFVAEGVGARLQVLRPDGSPLHVLPSPGQARLCGVACHADRVYVTELLAHRLHAFRLAVKQ